MVARYTRGMTRTAVVTGANRGLGLEVVKQLAAQGFTVIAGARDEAKGNRALRGVKNVVVRSLDVSDDSSVTAFGAWLEVEGLRVDALVNNAAIHYDTWHDVLNADLREVHETLETNLFGAWRVTLACLPAVRRGQDARVVNVSSSAGQLEAMRGGTPGYSLSKLGLNGLTLMLAERLKRDQILVNAVCPGWVATDMGGGGRPIPEGAAGIVWAATRVMESGGFYRDGKRLEW
jgi:NAD(P)-dependent dehydrogenase (short-subunit alcohol dehydrogenase family)